LTKSNPQLFNSFIKQGWINLHLKIAQSVEECSILGKTVLITVTFYPGVQSQWRKRQLTH